MIGMVVARPALSGECTIEITSPPKGDGVGKEVMVEGTAMIPTEAHLWVLAGVQGLKQWWPQGGGDSQIEDGQWTVLAFIGQEHDIGRLFRIAAIVVNEDTDNRLRQWVEEAPAKGYPPITFPSTFPGCPPVQVTVKKISH
jgi:hypothetical protein